MVAAAAELARDRLDVHAGMRAQAHLDLRRRPHLAEQHADLRAADRARLVGQVMRVNRVHAGAREHVERQPHHGDAAARVQLQRAQRLAAQGDERGAVLLVNLLRGEHVLRSALHQVGRRAQRSGRGVREREPARVRENGHVEAGRRLGRDRPAGGRGEAVDHLADRAARGIHPVHVAEPLDGRMMVYGHGRQVRRQPLADGLRAAPARQVQRNHEIVIIAQIGGGSPRLVHARQEAVRLRDGAVVDDVRLLPARAEDAGEPSSLPSASPSSRTCATSSGRRHAATRRCTSSAAAGSGGCDG